MVLQFLSCVLEQDSFSPILVVYSWHEFNLVAFMAFYLLPVSLCLSVIFSFSPSLSLSQSLLVFCFFYLCLSFALRPRFCLSLCLGLLLFFFSFFFFFFFFSFFFFFWGGGGSHVLSTLSVTGKNWEKTERIRTVLLCLINFYEEVRVGGGKKKKKKKKNNNNNNKRNNAKTDPPPNPPRHPPTHPHEKRRKKEKKKEKKQGCIVLFLMLRSRASFAAYMQLCQRTCTLNCLSECSTLLGFVDTTADKKFVAVLTEVPPMIFHFLDLRSFKSQTKKNPAVAPAEVTHPTTLSRWLCCLLVLVVGVVVVEAWSG